MKPPELEGKTAAMQELRGSPQICVELIQDFIVGGVAGDDVTSHAPSEAALTFISVFPYFLHAQPEAWERTESYLEVRSELLCNESTHLQLQP